MSLVFDDVEFDTERRLVSVGDDAVHLSPKAFQLLEILVANRPGPVSKQALIDRLWPDVVVEEANLANLVSDLRQALRDQRRTHRLIRTVFGYGYAFDRPADVVVHPRPRRVLKTSSILLLAVIVAAAVTGWVIRAVREQPGRSIDVRPLTAAGLYPRHPALSPDGRQIAYTAQAGDNARHLYVQFAGRAERLQLTRGAVQDSSPAWHPNGTELVFLRATGRGHDVLAISPIGGPERSIARSDAPPNGVAFSPDGKWLAFADRDPPTAASTGIALMSTSTGKKKMLNKPVPSPPSERLDVRDAQPVFSPDGTEIAFIRYQVGTGGGGPILVQRLSDTEPRTLVTESRFIAGIAWDARNDSILFSSGATPKATFLIRVPVRRVRDGGSPFDATEIRERFRLPFGEGAKEVSVAGNRLVLSRRTDDVNIWRIPGPAAASPTPPQKVIASTRDDWLGSFSPDGKQIAFVSDRERGEWEIWVCAVDGSHARRLTSMSHAIFPQWSPAPADRIAFSSFPEDVARRGVYVVDAGGAIPKRVTEGGLPAWSPDGQWLLFQSQRGGMRGGFQIFRARVDGTDVVQLTSRRGIHFKPRQWGERIYFGFEGSIWSVPFEGGEETKLVDDIYELAWTLWNGHLVFATRSRPISIDMVNLVTGKRTRLHTYPRDFAPALGELAVTPDARSILWTQTDNRGEELILVDNYQ